MDELLEKWIKLKDKEVECKNKREDVEAEIYLLIKDKLPSDGCFTEKINNKKITIKQSFSVSVDQSKASIYPDLFKVKYELSWSQYKKSDNKKTLDNIVTVKSCKPNFTVEKVEGSLC